MRLWIMKWTFKTVCAIILCYEMEQSSSENDTQYNLSHLMINLACNVMQGKSLWYITSLGFPFQTTN